MRIAIAIASLLLVLLAGCAGRPVAEDVPVPAGDGFVWVLKDGGRSALWGPRNSEALFAVVCEPVTARVELHHYGLAAPPAGAQLHIRADGETARYPAQVRRTAMGAHLVAAVAADDPFLERLLQAAQWQVDVGAAALSIPVSLPVLRPVLEGCRT